jgi:acetyl-CoA carboxylase biotin carboxyl carrier protein
MDTKEIKGILDLMSRHGLTEFEMEKGDFKIRLKKTSGGEPIMTMVPTLSSSPQMALPLAAAPLAAATAPVEVSNTKEIVSPMVGTFYRSPSPDSGPYAEVGKEVTEDTVVCIIEAMKVMNEIKAEMSGIITEIVAENGKPVEFGKPLFRVKPR